MITVWHSESEDETRSLGAALARHLLPNGVLLLEGDLGTGKTVLAQGLASGLGIDSREVLSPSFILMREHLGSLGRLLHVDLYRLDAAEVEGLGLWEVLAGPGVKVVEWCDRLPFPVPGAWRIEIRTGDAPNRRELLLIARPGLDQEGPNSIPKRL